MQNWYVAAVVGVVVLSMTRRFLASWTPRFLVLLTCGVSTWMWWRYGGTDSAWSMLAFGWWCAALSAVDLGCRRLPNALTLTGAGVVNTALVVGGSPLALIGSAALGAIYLSVHLAVPSAFGAGDVKLACSLGGVAALGGIDGWVMAALLAPVATALVGLSASALGHRRARIPHGPSMCVATLLASAASLA